MKVLGFVTTRYQGIMPDWPDDPNMAILRLETEVLFSTTLSTEQSRTADERSTGGPESVAGKGVL